VGIKWWLLTASGEVSRDRAVTQTIKLTLDSVTLDPNGTVVNISSTTKTLSGGTGSVSLDDAV